MIIVNIRNTVFVIECVVVWIMWSWGRRWWRLCTKWWAATLHLLEVAVHHHHPLFHGLYLLWPLHLITLVLLIQLHVPPVDLLELPLHRFIQCMDPIMDVILISHRKPSSKHRTWIIWLAVRSSHTVNAPLVVAAYRLGPYLIVANRWASRSAPIPLLRLLWSAARWTHATIGRNKTN